MLFGMKKAKWLKSSSLLKMKTLQPPLLTSSMAWTLALDALLVFFVSRQMLMLKVKPFLMLTFPLHQQLCFFFFPSSSSIISCDSRFFPYFPFIKHHCLSWSSFVDFCQSLNWQHANQHDLYGERWGLSRYGLKPGRVEWGLKERWKRGWVLISGWCGSECDGVFHQQLSMSAHPHITRPWGTVMCVS